MAICLFCSSISQSVSVYEDSIYNSKRFKYLKCNNCNLIFVDQTPTQEDFEKMYPVSYQGTYSSNGEIKYKYIFDLIERYHNIKDLRILDYGCGAGQFAQEAIQKKLNTTGAEFSPDLIVKLKSQQPNAQFYTIADFINSDPSQDSYDVIILNNVLEHLPNPIEIVEMLKLKLNPNGIFIFIGPIENNFSFALLFRKALFAFRKFVLKRTVSHPPRHLFYSNQKNQKSFFWDRKFKEEQFLITETNWPFPSNWNTTIGMKEKFLYLVGSLSCKLKRLNRNWGNGFIYVGRMQ